MGGPGSGGIYHKPNARHFWLRRKACGKPPRSRVFPWKSRWPAKRIILNFREGLWISFQPGLNFISQSCESRSRARILNDLIPSGIAIQFRQNGGQIRDQPFPLLWRQGPNSCFNFLDRTHEFTLTQS